MATLVRETTQSLNHVSVILENIVELSKEGGEEMETVQTRERAEAEPATDEG